MDQQSVLVAQHRQDLLTIFCHYDNNKLSQDELEEHLRALGIRYTHALDTLIKHNCNNMRFNEFIVALQVPDDKVVTQMEREAADIVNPASTARAYNPLSHRYDDKSDFLRWSTRLPPLPQTGANTIEQTEEQPVVAVEQINTYDVRDVNERLRELFKSYCDGYTSVEQLEQEIKSLHIKLDPRQAKTMAECRSGGNVSLNQLYLAFGRPEVLPVAPKFGNFSTVDGINAQRQPVVLQSHPSDVIAWSNGGSAGIALKSEETEAHSDEWEMTSPTTGVQTKRIRKMVDRMRKSSIFGSQYKPEMVEDFAAHLNVKCESEHPYADQSKIFGSQLNFTDAGVMPKEDDSVNTIQTTRAIDISRSVHLKPTVGMLDWVPPTAYKSQTKTTPAQPVSWTKYTHDERFPYDN